MWRIMITALLIAKVHGRLFIAKNDSSKLKSEQIIFASDFNITKLLVPVDIQVDTSEIPSIFFAIADPKLEGGSCIYVLEGFAAYEILEGGRDATADYSFDKTIYFGARDGIYKYCPETLSAKKYGPFRDDIIQLQKANGSDTIFILTSEHKLYKIEKNGTVKTRVQSISCALEFVLDTSNNIYYLSCDDRMPHIIKSDGQIQSLTASVIEEDIREVKLIRPAFIMEGCIPFFGDGYLYILYSNGTSKRKDLYLEEKPSAVSVDAALYLVAALDGKIYEYNVMDVLLKSLFGLESNWPIDITEIVLSIMDSAKDTSNAHGLYKEWNANIL